MKGIILAGGEGTRLHPLTKITSKQLLPVYDRPMIYYPLNTLLKAGISDILIIVAPKHSSDFLDLLGSGKEFGAHFTYEIQDKPEGIAQAFQIGADFIDGENCALILGDNIFTDDFTDVIKSFKTGAKIFAKKVPDPERFGVVDFKGDKVISIEEKPKNPKSFYAQTGFYLYDNSVIEKAKNLKPSARGELEITDLNITYLKEGNLSAEVVKGDWFDAGTFESLHEASLAVRKKKLGEPSIKVTIKTPQIHQSEFKGCTL
ncbi:NTP transferase domain-containing protein [Patescibacteria group bacterium]|nr:NTP transferase domain-containing protein [Patescibacteria group bacterium]MBU1683250.1 NTP transferase domain-containing protein [Patescibacteria group bacterium]MBU1934857.1 NTP transferase domain-containing protein [Patescibacteria group bacterium]